MVTIKHLLEQELDEAYIRPGRSEHARLIDTLEVFLAALPEREVSEPTYHVVKSAIHESIVNGRGFPYQLALALLTYVNSCLFLSDKEGI